MESHFKILQPERKLTQLQFITSQGKPVLDPSLDHMPSLGYYDSWSLSETFWTWGEGFPRRKYRRHIRQIKTTSISPPDTKRSGQGQGPWEEIEGTPRSKGKTGKCSPAEAKGAWSGKGEWLKESWH